MGLLIATIQRRQLRMERSNLQFQLLLITKGIAAAQKSTNELMQVGTDYEIKAKEIAKYKLSKVVGNEKGKYIDGELVVTYVYETIPDTGVYASDYSVVVSVMSIAIFMTLVFFKKKMFN